MRKAIETRAYGEVRVIDDADVSAKDGTFKLANVPAGTYTVEAYHRKGGKVSQKVTVGGDNVKADFTIEVKAE